jgi:aminoglycoside phosphotransferase (APT) family kinase protein
MQDLAQRIQAVLTPEFGGTPQVLVAPLGHGSCQENFRVDVQVGGASQRLVLRSDARSSLPGSISRQAEFGVIEAAVAHGVLTPRARWFQQDLVRPGAGAYFLDWVDGEAVGARVVRSPELQAARAVLPEQLAGSLAAIHQVTPKRWPDLDLQGLDRDPASYALGFLRRMLDRLPHSRPGLEWAWTWCRDHCPSRAATTLVHGDFRTGNFLVDPSGLGAVLDWEFAHWGDPMDDLGWLCVRDWRFGALNRPAGGLCTRERFYGAYQAASGRAVDPARVHFWEVVGNLRWGAAAIFQGERVLSGASTDLELLAIPRRASEMAYEALRLIEVGPPSL